MFQHFYHLYVDGDGCCSINLCLTSLPLSVVFLRTIYHPDPFPMIFDKYYHFSWNNLSSRPFFLYLNFAENVMVFFLKFNLLQDLPNLELNIIFAGPSMMEKNSKIIAVATSQGRSNILSRTTSEC